jgi:hypothetical protein
LLRFLAGSGLGLDVWDGYFGGPFFVFAEVFGLGLDWLRSFVFFVISSSKSSLHQGSSPSGVWLTVRGSITTSVFRMGSKLVRLRFEDAVCKA